MNKSYRIVWNHVRNCLMVVSEATKSRGKGAASKAVVETVAAAVMAIGAGQALGATDFVIDTPTTSQQVLGSGDTLLVDGSGTLTGSITLPTAAAVLIEAGTVAGYISNSGTIIGSPGIHLDGTWSGAAMVPASVSNIVNSGRIEGVNNGSVAGIPTAVLIEYSTVTGAIINTGLVTASASGIAIKSGSSIQQGITNAGQIIGGTSSGSAISIFSGVRINGGITNMAGASIVGQGAAAAIDVNGYFWNELVAGGIINRGVIENQVGPAIEIRASDAYATVAGGILNTNGTVIGDVLIQTSGVLTNTVTASAVGTTISGPAVQAVAQGALFDANTQMTGDLRNAGRVIVNSTVSLIGQGTDEALATASGVAVINGSDFTGNIYNSGSMTVNASATGIANIGVRADGVLISASTLVGGITNAGAVSVNARAADGGGLSPNPTLVANAVSVQLASVTGGINNTGNLTSNLTMPDALLALGVAQAYGINVAGSTIGGYVRNAGVINATASAAGDAGGSLSAYGIGVSASTVTGVVANSGTISATVHLAEMSEATLAGWAQGIEVADSNVSAVTNTGRINVVADVTRGTLTGISEAILGGAAMQVLGGTVQGVVSNGGTLSTRVTANATGGATAIGYGINVKDATVSGAVLNTGSISATASSWANNNSSGSALSDATGVAVQSSNVSGVSVAGKVNATATVTGGANQTAQAIGVGLDQSSIAGDFKVNGGTVTAYAASDDSATAVALQISGTTVAGSGTISSGLVSNDGSLSAYAKGAAPTAYGLQISNGSFVADAVQNSSTGQISATALVPSGSGATATVAGVAIQGSTLAGGLDNYGSITATILTSTGTFSGGAAAGIVVQNASVAGAVTNRASGLIVSSGDGIDVASANIGAGIENLGSISALNKGISVQTSTANTLVNSGTITAGNRGIEISGSTISGPVNNFGSIAATNAYSTAVVVNASSIGGNFQNDGTIQGVDRVSGVLITHSTIAGAIFNNGLINTNRMGLRVNASSVSGNILNTGSIASTGGIKVFASTVQGSIINVGTVNGSAGPAINVNASRVQTSLINQGSLQGNSYGLQIELSTIAGALTNSGVIRGVHANSTGLNIAGSSIAGTVSNDAQGTISGGNTGVAVSTSTLNDFVNQGTISGGSTGVAVSTSTLNDFVNNGLVSASGATSTGIWVAGSTLNSLSNTGTVAGGDNGLYVFNGSNITGAIRNTGSISATAADAAAIIVSAAIVGSITNSGQINSAITGVDLNAANVGGFVNEAQGTILGTAGSAIRLQNASSFSGGFINRGKIQSNSTGASTAALALWSGSGINGVVSNSGLIEATAGAHGILLSSAQINGGIRNTTTGTISGMDAIHVVGSGAVITGGISNTGLISGTASGIGIWNGSSVDYVANAGTIIGGESGIVVTNSGHISSDITNAGLIQGNTNAGILISDSSNISGRVINRQGATISGANYGILVAYGSSSIAEGITNSGRIEGSSIAGVAVIVNSIGASIVNSATGTITGAEGILIRGSEIGAIVNNGLISSNGQDTSHGAIRVRNSHIVSGIVNSGRIDGGASAAGIFVYGSSLIEGGVTNSSSGTIRGAVGVRMAPAVPTSSWPNPSPPRIFGGVINHGLIQGTGGTAILVENGVIDGGIVNLNSISGDIVNSGGTIQGTTAIALVSGSQMTGRISNTGMIQGSYGINVVSGATMTGGIANSGTIFGSQTGINLWASHVQGGITNSGRIEGVTYSGINIVNGSVLDGGINNQDGGSIVGKTAAIYLGSGMITGGITNSGWIQGRDGVAINIDVFSQVDGGILSTVGGTIVGDIHNAGLVQNIVIASDPSSVNALGYAIMLDSSSMSGNIINDGELAVSAVASLTGAGNAVANAMGIGVLQSTLTGDISNTGLIISTASSNFQINTSGAALTANAVGINVAASRVIGSIVNAGTLSVDASTYADSNASSFNVRPHALGINVENSILTGSIVNTGSISATAVSLVQSGQPYNYVTATGVRFAGSTISGGIINSGSVVVSALGSGGESGSANAFGLNIANASVAGSVIISGSISVTASGGNANYQYGIAASNSTIAGAISNAGMIDASANGIGVGVFVSSSSVAGGIVNRGTIAAGSTGINIAAGAVVTGGILNAGMITATGANPIGIYVNASSVDAIINSATGTISGGLGVGLGLNNGAQVTTIVNHGLIQGDSVAIDMQNGSRVLAGLSNQSGGTISSVNYGIELQGGSSVIGGINNAGMITTSGGAAIFVDGSYVDRIYNSTSGTISSDGIGVRLYSSSVVDSIANHGLIQVSGDGVAVRDRSLVTGGITNTGQIISASNGIYLSDAVVNGGITNHQGATISGATGINLYIDSYETSVTGGIVNAGLITASGVGIYVDESYVDKIHNSASGVISAVSTGINLRSGAVVGSIINAGLITASGTGVYVNSAMVDTIVNSVSGTISGGMSGIALNGTNAIVGSIVNHGLIKSSGSGYSAALALWSGSAVTGGIINSGRIDGGATAVGVLVSSSAVQGGITNQLGGTITGATGIKLDAGAVVSGGIANAGLITASGQAISVINSTINGGIANVNGGVISGGVYGVYVDPSVINGGITNAGLITGGAAAIALSYSTVNGGILNTGTLRGDSLAGLLAINGSTVNGGITTSGLIAGGTLGSIYVDGTSSVDRLVITGNNTASFSGDVVSLGNPLPVTVAGGATYTMDNTIFSISGGTFSNEGTLIAPVASVARPTIDGNFAMQNTGTFNATVLSATNYTQVTVSGNVALAGSVVVDAATVPAGAIRPGSTLVGLITAGSSVTGAFASYSDNSRLYNFIPVYDPLHFNLAIVRDPNASIYKATKAMGNNAGLGSAAALDNIAEQGGMTDVIGRFGQMTSDVQISNAVSQTLPVMSGAGVWSTMGVLSSINRIIEARHLQNKGISTGEDFTGSNGVWMKPFGNWQNQANNNGAYGFRGNTGGLMIGGDTVVEKDTRVGGAFAWGNTSVQSNAGVAPQTQTSNMYQFIGYGSYALTDRLEANFMANGGWNSNNSNRQIGFMGTSAQGSYNSAVWHVGAGLSQPFDVSGDTQIIPSARFDYNWIRNQAYSETGASNGLGLNVDSQTYQMSILGANAKVVHKLSDHNSVNANLGVNYNFSPTQTYVAAAFQGSPGLQFTTNGINPQAVMGQAGVGYTYKLKENVDVGIRYDLDFQSQYTNQTATAKARWMF